LSGNDDMVRLLIVKNADFKAPLFNIKPHELALAFHFDDIAKSIADYKKLIKEVSNLLMPIYTVVSHSESKRLEPIVDRMNELFLQRVPVEDILKIMKEVTLALKKDMLAAQELNNMGMFSQSYEHTESDEVKHLYDSDVDANQESPPASENDDDKLKEEKGIHRKDKGPG